MSGDQSRDIRTGGGMYNENGQVYNNYGNQNYGSQVHGHNLEGGSVYAGRDYYSVGDDRPYYHTLRPVGRVLVALGSACSLAGFAMVGYFVLSGIGDAFASNSSGVTVPEPHFDAKWFGPGVTLFFAGIVLICIGSAVGRRARPR